MQILTVEQIEYCHLLVKQSAQTLCVPGLSFHNQLFVREQIFAQSEQQAALNYCQQMYLIHQGSKFYLLLREKIGFTVWLENKSARIIGSKSPDSAMEALRLSKPVARIKSLGTIDIASHSLIDSAASQKLIKRLEASLQQATLLCQKIME